MVALRSKQSGLFPRLGEYSNVGSESGKRKTTPFGICDIRSTRLQVPSFPRARPRMSRCRREVWVAASQKSAPTWVGGTEIFPVPPFWRQPAPASVTHTEVGRLFLR